MGGISSILGALALLGFLLFLGGIGMIVLSASQGRPVRSGALLAVVGLVAGLLFSVVSQGILIVQPQEVAVIFNTLSGNLEQPRRAGTHIVIPVVQEATLYPIEQQQYTMAGGAEEGPAASDDAVNARTVDGQEVRLDVTVIYAINPDEVNVVHQRWRNRYENDFIRATTRGFARDVVSRFRAEEIYGAGRGELETSIQELLANRMNEEGLTLTDVLIRDITFSTEFAAAIERAQIAQQEAQQAQLRVQQRTFEAQQLLAQAEGERNAAITRAEGEAQATILRAQADAEALRLVSQQIAANPSLIQYQYIQNLSDQVQLMLVPSNSPFLFDFASLAQPNAEFTAPDIPESGTLTVPELPEVTPPPLIEVTPLPGS